LFKQTLDKP